MSEMNEDNLPQTEIERKLQQQAELLNRPAVPSEQNQPPLSWNSPPQPSGHGWAPQQSGPSWPPAQTVPAWPPAPNPSQPAGVPFQKAPGLPGAQGSPPQAPGLLARWKAKGGILGSLATILIFLAKVGAPIFVLLGKLKFLLIAGKFLLTGGSMIASMWIESKIFGWPLAVGIVLLIFIHECGHALAARLRGIPMGFMLFVPMMGAFVTTKRYGKNLEEDAFIGIMGPIVGSLASLACLLMYFPTGSPFWLVLGQWGFFINLFNLLPTPPLDGGWIAPLFSPKLLAVGMVIAFVVGFRNPLIWLLLVMSIPRVISGWKADPKTMPYYQVSLAAKWKYGVLYLGLAACLALGGSAVNGVMVQ